MLPIASDGWPYIWKLALGALISFVICLPLLGYLFLGLAVFVGFFFRDPDRDVPMDPNVAVSPADGKVMRVEEVDEEFVGGKGVKISIFLNIFNVHINRTPISGEVKLRKFKAGKMLPAYKSHASEENERNTIGLEGRNMRAVVHQITGLVARRIVCNVDVGDKLVQGQRYGLIKFGSCTELVLPAGTEICVKPGQKVVGGETVLARW